MTKQRDIKNAFTSGPLPTSTRDGKVLCWSFQPPAVFDCLRAGEIIKTTKAHVQDAFEEWPPDRVAYEWMSAQVKQRLGRADFEFPMWAYVRATKGQLLAKAVRLAPRREKLLCLAVKPSEIVVSDMSLWGSIYGHLDSVTLTKQEYFRYEARAKVGEMTEEQTRATWPLIFELDRIEQEGDAAWLGRSYLQGCLAEFRPDQLVAAWDVAPRRALAACYVAESSRSAGPELEI